MSAETSGKRGRPPVQGLAERRSEEILSVATKVFAGNGLRATDVQEIADLVGVGKGTVYRYFPSKDELFLATVHRALGQLTEAMRSVFGEDLDPLTRMKRLAAAFLDFFEANPDYVEVLILERAEFRDRGRLTFFEYRDALKREFREFEDELEQAGVLRHVPGGPEGDALAQLLYGAIFTHRFAGDERSPEVQRAALLDVLYRGILK